MGTKGVNPKGLAHCARQAIHRRLKLTTQKAQLLQQTGHVHPVNQGVVGLHCNRQHLLAVLQEGPASADQWNRPIGRGVGVLDAGETQPRQVGEDDAIVEASAEIPWLGCARAPSMATRRLAS